MLGAYLRELYTKRYRAISIVLPISLFVVIFFLGCLVTLFWPPTYESHSLLWIQPRMPVEATQPHILYPLGYSSANPYSTVSELFKSKAVLAEALASLKGRLPPSQCPTIEQLSSALTVSPVRETDVVVVRYRSTSPQVSRAVLRELLDSFFKLNSSQLSATAIQSQKILEQQLKWSRDANLTARNNLNKFQDEHGAINVSEQVERMIAREQVINSKIEDIKLQISEQRAKVDGLRGRLHVTLEETDIARRLAQDDVIKNLRQLVAEREISLIDLKSRMKQGHPRARRAQRALERAKTALNERVREVAGDAGVSVLENQVAGDDTVQQKLIDRVLDAEDELAALDTKLAKWTSSAVEIRSQLKDLPALEDKEADLAREVATTSQAVSDAEQKVNAAKAAEAAAVGANNIRIIDPPNLPAKPVLPNIPLNLAISFTLGLIVSGAAFNSIRLTSPFVRQIRDIAHIVPRPVLGWIDSPPGDMRLVDMLPAMQHLRLSWKSSLSAKHKIIVVTSSDPGDGKTIVAAGLALSFAQSGARVVLVDANFDSPGLHGLFAAPTSPGLCDYIASANPDLLATIIKPAKPNLHVIPAGDVAKSHGEIDSSVFGNLLEHLKSEADVVVIDTPAMSESDDAVALLNDNIHLLLVIRLNHSLKDSLRLATAQLDRQQIASGAIFVCEATGSDVAAALDKGSPEREPAEAIPW